MNSTSDRRRCNVAEQWRERRSRNLVPLGLGEIIKRIRREQKAKPEPRARSLVLDASQVLSSDRSKA